MSSDELNHRVNLIYAALEGIKERDLRKFPPQIVDAKGVVHFWQDFRGGLSDAEIWNAAHSLIHNIAHLEDHLKRWAARNGIDKAKVASPLQGSQPFLILKDLSNRDKHGPLRPGDSGHSGLAPRIAEVRRSLQLRTRPEKGSSVAVILTPQGPKQVGGTGTSEVIITGDVVDADGKAIGDVHDLAVKAVEVVEAFLEDLRIKLPSPRE